MYKPFSVKAFGKALVFANFVVESFDRKSANSVALGVEPQQLSEIMDKRL